MKPSTPIYWMIGIHVVGLIVWFSFLGALGGAEDGTPSKSMWFTVSLVWFLVGIVIAPTITVFAIIWSVRLRRRTSGKAQAPLPTPRVHRPPAAAAAAPVVVPTPAREAPAPPQVAVPRIVDEPGAVVDAIAMISSESNELRLPPAEEIDDPYPPAALDQSAATTPTPTAPPATTRTRSRATAKSDDRTQRKDAAEAIAATIPRAVQRLTFTAIDFETANAQRASACAIGLTVVVEGAVQGAYHWLIQPPDGGPFTNTHIHGISEADVQDAASWTDSVETLLELHTDGAPLVAYNSAFDAGVLNAACAMAGIPAPTLPFRDALVPVRAHLELPRYRLPDVARHLSLPEFSHHDAGMDALACAAIVTHLAERAGAATCDDLWATGSPQTSKRGFQASSSAAMLSYSSGRLPARNIDADPSHPLYGVSITFSGELGGFTRQEARLAAAERGAHVTAGPTKRTEVIVIGGFDPATFSAGATTSKSVARALALQAEGQKIEMIGEADFVRLVNGGQSSR